MPVRKNYLLVLGLLLFNFLTAQNYQAINGSSYAGSLSTANNPASIVHVPYAWDITPFSLQLKQSTNAFRIEKYSFLSSPGNAEVKPENGIKRRFFFANQDIRLLNTRISLNTKTAIAFGANIRNYMYATSSRSNYQDSIYSLSDFLKINLDHLPFSGELSASAWAEIYATYARTIIDDGTRLLNVGISLKINRALAGGYARTQEIDYVPEIIGNRQGYSLTTGNLQYGYSYNFDNLDSNKSFKDNRKTFLQHTYAGFSADVGLEYILRTDEDEEEGGDFAYHTKIGISLMDIGNNKYSRGSRSSLAIAGLPGITDTLLENKVSGISNIDNFNDSLASISRSFNTLNGDFYIYQPTRLVINVDQHITGNFFINAELTVPLLPIIANNTLFIKDLNLLAVTPRWELKSIGAYFPILLNTRKQLWVGGAFKLGPVLLGTHNIGGIFSKNKAQAGGLYIAFTIRPAKAYDREAHYPKDKISRGKRRLLNCPKF